MQRKKINVLREPYRHSISGHQSLPHPHTAQGRLERGRRHSGVVNRTHTTLLASAIALSSWAYVAVIAIR